MKIHKEAEYVVSLSYILLGLCLIIIHFMVTLYKVIIGPLHIRLHSHHLPAMSLVVEQPQSGYG